MAKVTVRPAAEGDLDAATALIVEEARWHIAQWPADFGGADDSSTPGLRSQLLESVASASLALLVAEVSGSVVGVISGSVADKPAGGLSRYDGPVAYVGDLMVAPTHRKQGVGAALMAAFESWARAQGAATVRLYVHSGNHAAEALYDGAGFRRVHIEMRKDLA